VPVKTKSARQFQLARESRKHLRCAARRAYAGQKKQFVSNEQIAELLPLVGKVVQRVVSYIKPPLSYEDLVSAGTVGLVKAARDYDPTHQAEFRTYAYIRIRGAILDELRSWSFVPPNVDKQIREALQASLEIAEQTGQTPSDEQLAEKLAIPLEKLYEVFESARAKQFVSMNDSSDDCPPLGDVLAATDTCSPHENAERNELADQLARAISELNQRQRQIILLYYQQQLTMKQIAKVFNITEPRVSQLHAGALFNLSLKLRQWKDGG